MKTQSWHARVTVLALLLLGTAAVYFTPPQPPSNTLPVVPELPRAIGFWHSIRLLYCHNPTCLLSVPEPEAPNHACPHCQTHPMIPDWSLGEKQMLPEGTLILRRQYSMQNQPPWLVTVVITGAERAGIHRPQMCLPGQGVTIEKETTIPFRSPAYQALDGRLLDLAYRTPAPQGFTTQPGFYVYWFTDGRHETPYYTRHLILSSMDRLIRGQSRRWAYIAISGPGRPDNPETQEALAEFTLTIRHALKPTHTETHHAP